MVDGSAPVAPPVPAAPPGGSSLWTLRPAALFVLAAALFGIGGRAHLIESGLTLVRRETPLNVFYRLYALHELPLLVVLALFSLAVLWSTRRTPASSSRRLDRLATFARRLPAKALAAGVLAVTALGTLVVMHGIGLSMDEFAASFQARIFSTGRATASVPPAWQALVPWTTPVFVTYKLEAQAWVAAYLPVYAALRTPFVLLRAEWLLNPLLAAASVLLLDRVARRLWPGAVWPRLAALAFLVTSTQFLATSMTGYAMPAHLCLNLLWLLLYLRDDRAGWLAAPWVGALALGLHNPFPHALFVAPFLIRMLLRRRFGWLAYAGAVYAVSAVAWLAWLRFASAGGGGGGGGSTSAAGLLGSFRLPDAGMGFVHALDLTLVFSWQTPVLPVLLLVALFAWRRLGAAERDLAAGLLLTFAFYLLFPANQGHGWGYRYIYGALGNVALLAAAGAAIAARQLPRERVRALVAASLLVTVAVQLPLRFRQIERFVHPYASAMAFIAARPAPLIAVDFNEGAYVWDLIRNDPLFGDGARVIAYSPDNAPPLEALPPAVRDSVYLLSRPDMARFGIPLFPPRRAALER